MPIRKTRRLWCLIILFIQSGCDPIKQIYTSEDLLAHRLDLITHQYADPRPWAKYLKDNHGRLEEYRLNLVLGNEQNDPETADSAVAGLFYIWEDWQNVRYFLSAAQKKRSEPKSALLMAKLGAEIEEPGLLKSLTDSQRRQLGEEYDVLFEISSRNYSTALDLLDQLTRPNIPQNNSLRWSHNCVWKAKVLKRMMNCSGIDVKLNGIFDLYLDKKMTFDELLEATAKSKITSIQKYLVDDMIIICREAYLADVECQNLVEAQEWQTRGLRLVNARIRADPYNVRYKVLLLPKFENMIKSQK